MPEVRRIHLSTRSVYCWTAATFVVCAALVMPFVFQQGAPRSP